MVCAIHFKPIVFLPQPVLTPESLYLLVENIIKEKKYTFQTYFEFLTSNQIQLLKAIAKEGVVNQINASSFIKKYNLKAASRINAALKTLREKEFILKERQGYRVYDRFLAIWLKRLV